jgi:diguanylate cyclase (GGDEF)-like protein
MQYMCHPIEDFKQDLATLRAVFETVHQPVFVVDARDQRIVNANPAACQTLGIARAELIGRSWASTAARLSGTALRNVETAGDFFIVLAAQSILNRTEKRDSRRDTLTGLPTRDALQERISWDSRPDPSSHSALLFIDLDNFKQVNDTWGHLTGDRVLQVIAQRLASCIRPKDLLVRFGGDEFIVLVEDVRRRRDLERLARRIRRGVQTPALIAGNEFIITASIGIAERNADSLTIDALIAKADRDMYRAKCRNRKPAVEIYPAAYRFGNKQPTESISDPPGRNRRVANATT